MELRNWFIYVDDDSEGPFTKDELVQKIRLGILTDEHLICQDGEEVWHKVSEHPKLQVNEEAGDELPPPPPMEEDEGIPNIPVPLEDEVVEQKIDEEIKEVILFEDEGNNEAAPEIETVLESEAEPTFVPEVPGQETTSPVFAEEAAQKSQSRVSLWLSLVIIIAAGAGGFFWWKKGATNFSLPVVGVAKVKKKSLDKIVNAPTTEKRHQLIFNEEGSEIVVATNLKEEAYLYLTIFSIKGRVLHSGRINFSSDSVLKNGKAIFKKFVFRRDSKLYHGEYVYKIKGYVIKKKDNLGDVLSLDMNSQEKIALRSKKRNDFEWRGTVLFFSGTKKAFELKLQQYRSQSARKEKPLLDRKERYETYMNFLNKVGTLYRDEMKGIKRGKKISGFEDKYNHSIGPYLRDLVIDSNKVHVSLVNLNPDESKAYENLTNFGKDVGALAADFVKRTESIRKISDKRRELLLEDFESSFTKVKKSGQAAIDDIRYELSGRTL